MIASSRRHLALAGETYAEHFRFALTVSVLTLGAGVACLIHAFVPGLCQSTCSRTLSSLQALFADRSRLRQVQHERQGVLTFVGLLALALATAALLLVTGGANPIPGALAAIALAFPAAYLAGDSELAATE
ncbi:MAG TPA: DUF6356 family protein [Allosphingosinicella sp.]|jgi:hypothetical protein